MSSFAQEKGYLEFGGRTVKDGKPLGGVKIGVFKSGQKVTELQTSKNGKFSFDLELGFDFKITFSSPGCADMYLVIYGAKCPHDKVIFPIYEIEIPVFENGKTTIDYSKFKQPFNKIIFDGKKTFKDDEQYFADFTKDLFIDPVEEMRKNEERLALEKALKEKELTEKLKQEAEERERLEQIAAAQKKAEDEALALKKLMEDKNKLEKKNEAQGNASMMENENKQSLVSEEIKLTLEKEQKKIKEKQNKAIKANYENDLLKVVAVNERKNREKQFFKQKKEAQSNEIIETLRYEAETKAKSSQTRFDIKMKNKQAVINSRVKNQEIISLVKNVAYNEKKGKEADVKSYPEINKFKAPEAIGVTTESEATNFSHVYQINVFQGKSKNVYRRVKYTWGSIYYYKNDKEITEQIYKNEVSNLNVPY
jgi:hypothetical protein